MKYFENVPVFLHGTGIVKSDLCFDRRIAGFAAEGERIVLPENAVVLPGFVDEHIHGAGGADAMDGTPEALSVISRTLVKEGTTSFLATTMTQSPENILKALSAVKVFTLTAEEKGEKKGESVKQKYLTGARLLGVHLEGPFISAAHKGAQPLEYVAAPSVPQFEAYQEASGGNIRIVTLAPEEAGAEALISHLVKEGVLVSVGHTGAKYADVLRAVEAGAKHVTHTFNAQSPLHHREIGTVGSALLLDGLDCELIADTIHVSVPAMQLLVKCKTAKRLILITDAIRAKGLGDGESELGGQKVYVKGGEARLVDGTLAGSVLQMNLAVKNMVERVGLTLCEAADCASYNPAKALGMEEELGSIALGKRADFTVLGPDFDVLMTIVDGEIVYRRAF